MPNCSDSRGKILPLERLAEELAAVRPGRSVVHCHGVFDLLHIGHIRHFEEARKLGDILVVTVTPDRFVNKGPHRPAFPEALRAEAVASLACVDYVAVNLWPTAVETIGLLRPEVYVKGQEYRDAARDRTGGIVAEEQAIRDAGGRIAFTEDIVYSSSTLLNRHFSPFPEGVQAWIDDFSSRRDADSVIGWLDRARQVRVLVVGEAIIDEYCFCDTLGKSGKEPILAARLMHSEKYAGGILAVANHAASFSDRVGLLTFLGTEDSHREFIEERLDPAVERVFLRMEGAPTLLKRRFVEHYPLQKLFEVYVMNGCEGSPAMTRDLTEALERMLPEYDAVVVTDYGHGMLCPEAAELLCAKSRFLAVNAQVNAGNMGFNTVSKYRRADYVCISEKELRLEARSRQRDLRDIAPAVADRIGCGRMLISQGNQGCLCWSREEGFYKVPALTNRIVDRVGAGDSVLAVTSLCAAVGAPMEVVGFIGNVIGAQAVSIVGNQRRVEKVPALKHIVSILK